MKKFITCLFLVCGLAAKAAVYSNQFTAIANPGTVTPLVPPLLISNQSSVSIKIITGNPQFTGDLSFLNNGHIWSFGASTNTFSLASSGAESGTIFSANSLTDTIQIGGSDYPNVSLSKLTVSGTSPGQLYLLGTNNGALGFSLNSNAVTTNIFLFDLRSVLAGQVIFAHSTNTIGTTNFIVMTNGWASNAFGGAFIASANGSGSNLTLRSVAGGPSLAMTVETNRIVVTNGFVGIANPSPSNALDIIGNLVVRGNQTNSGTANWGGGTTFVAADGAATFGTSITMGNTTPINWAAAFGISSDSGGPTFYGNGFAVLPHIYFGNRSDSSHSIVFSNTVLTANFRNGLKTNSVNVSARSYLIETGTNTVNAPAGLFGTGAQIWSDGTNLCVVLQNTAGTRTTNKLSMTAWP